MDNLNKINGNKDLYDRICVWMANQEDMTELMEDYPNTIRTTEEAKDFLLEDAMDIMNLIYQTCNDDPKDDIEGVPV
jgi:hypothetical protein